LAENVAERWSGVFLAIGLGWLTSYFFKKIKKIKKNA
jgi:dolichol kinase